jgi:hypothetical protein
MHHETCHRSSAKTLAAVRHLSESAVNNPVRKNFFCGLIPLRLEPAGTDPLPELREPLPEHPRARIRFLPES